MINKINNIKNKLLKGIFFYWIKKDFNRYMDLLEDYKLRRYVQNNLSDEIKKTQYIPNAIDYVASFIISMYSQCDKIPNALNSIDQEAKFLVKEFLEGYNLAIEKKDYDLLKYFAIPKIEFTEQEKKIFQEKKKKFQSNSQMYSEFKSKSYKELLDKGLELTNKFYNGKHKRFWRPGLKHYGVAIWCIIYQCVKDVRNFSEEYKINYIEDGEQRCLFNFFNLYIHGILFTGEVLLPIETRKVMFAASALHPVQDDYIDNNEVSDEILNDIYIKLLGRDVECKVPEVKPIFDFIDVIYNKYNPKEHPILMEIFIQLHKWQCKSVNQKKEKLEDNELLEISFMKGGYAFAFYGYLALGEMDILQFRHFFGMGAIFQIMDDLHDIEIDLKNNVETIWTKKINDDIETDEALYGIIGVQRKFESLTTTISSLKRPVFLRRMELFAVRLDLMKFYLANRKYFSDKLIDNVQYRFNIELRPYIDGYKLRLDKLKTMDDFEKMLIDIKNSYTKAFCKGN